MGQIGESELSPELEVSRGTHMGMASSTMRLNSQVKILTNDKNMRVRKGPFLPSEKADPEPVKIHLASTGLRASSHELPKTLPYKACLAGEALLRERY